jgi:2-hydroxychromene-2-carboxylate isomerase
MEKINSNKIDFYFDFLSPFSYLAYLQVKKRKWDVNFYPISLPNVISYYKTLGPGQIKPKRDYLARELFRYTTINNIPFQFPIKLPFNSLYALRLSLKTVSLQRQSELIDLFFNAAWNQGLDLGDDQLIEKILVENGFDKDRLMELISTKEVKLELRNNIEKALGHGVFGVPTFIVSQVVDDKINEELFWGNDSLNSLEAFLQNTDSLPREKYNKFINDYPM